MRFVEILLGIVILTIVLLMALKKKDMKMTQPNIEKIYNDYIDEKQRIFRQEMDKKKHIAMRNQARLRDVMAKNKNSRRAANV